MLVSPQYDFDLVWSDDVGMGETTAVPATYKDKDKMAVSVTVAAANNRASAAEVRLMDGKDPLSQRWRIGSILSVNMPFLLDTNHILA